MNVSDRLSSVFAPLTFAERIRKSAVVVLISPLLPPLEPPPLLN